MYKLLNLAVFIPSLFLFLVTAPNSYAACCPTSDTSCTYTHQCSDPGVVCTSAEECPSTTVCSPSKAPNSSYSQFDVRYCVGSMSRETISSIHSVKATCRKITTTAWAEILKWLHIPEPVRRHLVSEQVCACHEDNWSRGVVQNSLCLVANQIFGMGYNLAVDTKTFNNLPIAQDPASGVWYTCFTFESASREAGEIEIEVLDRQGNAICSSRVDTKPQDYSFWEALDALLGIDIYKDPTERTPYHLKCTTVLGKGVESTGINTAFGCIATDPVGFTQDFLTIAIGVGGSIALLLLLYAAILIALSQGNPQKIQSGQQIIAAVIQGLILITLSVVMLNFLGINILNLPGLQ